jgi:hypothetical protein
MEVINLEATEDTPRVILDKANNIYEISGRSLPEDAAEFYEPILNWLEALTPEGEVNFTFKLEYFNTASSKLILDVLSKLEEKDGITVVWYFHEEDEDMEEAGEEFADLVELDFDFKTY